MFGFDDIAGFAHNLEAAFDQLRGGQLAATTDLIALTLAAGDQIKTMLDEAAGRGAADRDRTAAIVADLRRLTGLPESRPALRPSLSAGAGRAASGPARDWRIRFRPGPDVLLNGTNPLLLLARARRIGRASRVARHRRRFRRSRRSIRNAATWPGTWCSTRRRRPRRFATSLFSSRTNASWSSSRFRRSPRVRKPAPSGSRSMRTRPAPRRASGSRPTSWTSWSTWWASW